jgi:hypothetical protein
MKIVSRFDLLSPTIKLNLNGQSYRTEAGGVCTILAAIACILHITFAFYDSKHVYTVQSQHYYAHSEASNHKANDVQFLFGFSITDLNDQPANIDLTYLMPYVSFISSNWTVTSLPNALQNCSKSQLPYAS